MYVKLEYSVNKMYEASATRVAFQAPLIRVYVPIRRKVIAVLTCYYRHKMRIRITIIPLLGKDFPLIPTGIQILS